MKIRILMLAISLLMPITACTSLQPVKMSPEKLQQNITSEDLIKVGNQVKVVTTNGKEYEFEVTSISTTHISGKKISVPIKDIVALEISEIDGIETTFLSGGLVALAVGFIVAASAGL